ncbi:hypothetical protein QL285_024066 [Trifolium repens]|nr:hypothetical protein QL285_024066 [Trifolium repens]
MCRCISRIQSNQTFKSGYIHRRCLWRCDLIPLLTNLSVRALVGTKPSFHSPEEEEDHQTKILSHLVRSHVHKHKYSNKMSTNTSCDQNIITKQPHQNTI